MSEEQVNAFMEAIRADAALQEKVSGAADADAAVAIAQEAGYSISREEIYWLLTEEALEGVVGGQTLPGSGLYGYKSLYG